MSKGFRRVALLTGGSQGIGFALAKKLRAQDIAVALVSRDESRLQECVERLGGGDGAIGIPCDVSVKHEVEAAVSACIDKFGQLDILVNSAGVSMRGPDPLTETRVEDWQRIIDTNLTGTYLMLRAAVPHLVQSVAADIINVQSTASYQSGSGVSLYSASKFGVRALTEALRSELVDSSVRVTSISPGPVATTIWSHKRQPPNEEEMSMMLQPADLANTMLFLLELPRHVQIDNVTITPRKAETVEGSSS